MKKLVLAMAVTTAMTGAAVAGDGSAYIAQIGNSNNAGNIQVNQPERGYASTSVIVQDSRNTYDGYYGNDDYYGYGYKERGQEALTVQNGGGNSSNVWQQDVSAGRNIYSAEHKALTWQDGRNNDAVTVQLAGRQDFSSTILQLGNGNSAVNWQSTYSVDTNVPSLSPRLSDPRLRISRPSSPAVPRIDVTANPQHTMPSAIIN